MSREPWTMDRGSWTENTHHGPRSTVHAKNNELFTFGLWLQLPPLALLNGEGIMAVLAEIMKAAAARPDTKVVVAMAKWTEEAFKSFLHAHRISLAGVELITSRQRLPLLLRLRQLLHKRTKRPARPSLFDWVKRTLRRAPAVAYVARGIRRGVGNAVRKALAVDSVLAATAVFVLGLGVLLACALPAALLWCFWKLVVRNPVVEKFLARLRRFYHKLIETKKQAISSRMVQWLTWAHNIVVEDEFRLLARVVSSRVDVSVWYVPHPAGVQACAIGRPLVVAVPDLVYADFPTIFNTTAMAPVDKRIREVACTADAVVTYSEYVRQEHVIRNLGPDAECAHVIPHGAMDLRPVLNAALRQHGGHSRAAAISVIRDFIRSKYRPSSWARRLPKNYLHDFPFGEVDFLFVSSQIRPHKNYLNLFRAFEIVLRRKRLNLKLFFTGRMDLDNSETAVLRDFIHDARLHLDIVSIPDLPADVHAAFYHLAKLTIVPTLFEGGFPFPFTESLSVDTPVIMSSIPVTRETVPPSLVKDMLFDPYEVAGIANRIAWGVAHRQELLEKQKVFYRQLRDRTWSLVLDDYLNVFRRTAMARQDSQVQSVGNRTPETARAA